MRRRQQQYGEMGILHGRGGSGGSGGGGSAGSSGGLLGWVARLFGGTGGGGTSTNQHAYQSIPNGTSSSGAGAELEMQANRNSSYQTTINKGSR